MDEQLDLSTQHLSSKVDWGWTYYKSTHCVYNGKGTRYRAKFRGYDPGDLWTWEDVWIDFVTTTPVKALRAICKRCEREGLNPNQFFLHHITVYPDGSMTSEAMYQ
jgi:hypothetical protein